jgi:hypothetical protein
MKPLAATDAANILRAALVDGELDMKTVALLGPTQMGFDEAARMVARVLGVRRVFARAPLAFHYFLASVCERLMTVPLISKAQVRILEEGLVDAARAPDALPDDLLGQVSFDEHAIRQALPEARRFGLSDLRLPALRERRVTVCGEGSAVMKRSAKAVMEFVLDVAQYRQADHKIGRILDFRREGNLGEVTHRGRFLRIPTPAVTLSFELTPDTRLTFTGTRMPWPLRGFDGEFTCQETAEGTLVTHRECLIFGPVVGRILRFGLQWWLSRDTPAEVRRIKQILENRETSP